MLNEKSDNTQSENKFSEVSSSDIFLDEISCFTLIQEFLVYKGLNKSSEQLYSECEEKDLECPSSDSIVTSITLEEAQELTTAYHSDDFSAFVKLWDEKVPGTAHSTDPDAWRLLFLSHVKYAVENQEAGMETLKSFIAQKPISANHKEMLQYYALPYISNPQTHQSFSHLYKESWSSELERNIQMFLKRYTRPHNKPRLMQLASTEHLHLSHKQVKKKHKQLQHDYQRLLAVAGELTTALESSVRGDVLDLASTLRNCTKIYPELFPCTRDPDNRSSPEAVLRRSLGGQKSIEFELDMRKVKSHLASEENNKTRLLLMQAIRWRITQTNPDDREHTVANISRHDLFGLRGGFSVLSLLLNPQGDTPHPLQQGVARLGNTLASLRTGRDYLSTQPDQVVGVVASCLTGNNAHVKIDDITADMLLALLQKLSLRRTQREAMITAGMVEWLIPKLELCLDQLRADSPTYALEYAAALLMNLCLHSRAKQRIAFSHFSRCVPLSGRALKLLSDMLGVAPPQVLPYVNGALYSLLSEPLINQQAKHMGLEKLLQFYLKQSDGELSRQLEHILRLHRGDCGPEPAETHSEDEGEADVASNMEILEEELDAVDPVRASGSEISGEELLREHYRQLFPAHGVVNPLGTQNPASFTSITAATRLLNRRHIDNVPDIPETEFETVSGSSFGAVKAASRFLNSRNNDNFDPELDEIKSDTPFTVDESRPLSENDPETGSRASLATKSSSNSNTSNSKEDEGSANSFGAVKAATRFKKSRNNSEVSQEVSETPENGPETSSSTSFGAVKAATRFRKSSNNSVNTPEVPETPSNESETKSATSFGSIKAATRFKKKQNSETTPEINEIEENSTEVKSATSFGAVKAATKFKKRQNTAENDPEATKTSLEVIENAPEMVENDTENPENNTEVENAPKENLHATYTSVKAASKFLKSQPTSENTETSQTETAEVHAEIPSGIPFSTVTAAAKLVTKRSNTAESEETMPPLSAVTATVRFLKNRTRENSPNTEENTSQSQPSLSAVSATVRILNSRASGAKSEQPAAGEETAEDGMTEVTTTDGFGVTQNVEMSVKTPSSEPGETQEQTAGTPQQTDEQEVDERIVDGTAEPNTPDTAEAADKTSETSRGVSAFFATPRLARTPPVTRRLVTTQQADSIASLLCGVSKVHSSPTK